MTCSKLAVAALSLLAGCAYAQKPPEYPFLLPDNPTESELYNHSVKMMKLADYRIEYAISGKRALALQSAMYFYADRLEGSTRISNMDTQNRIFGFFENDDEYVIRFGSITVPYHEIYVDDPTPVADLPDSVRYRHFPLSTIYILVSKSDYKVTKWQKIPSEAPILVDN